MDTSPDRLRAIALSLGLHLLVLLVLYHGLQWQSELRPQGAEGPAIEATLVGAPQRSSTASHPHVANPPPPTPQAVTPPSPSNPSPIPQEKPRQLQSQTQVPKPDTVDQDEVRRLAQQAAEQQQKEQEERRKQAQVDLDRKQEQLQAENRQHQAQADALARQLADIRARRAEAERQVKLAQEKLKQDADMRKALAQNTAPAKATANPAQHAAAGGGSDTGLLGKYKQAIIEQANLNWIHADAPEQVHCKIRFTQIPGGEVIDVRFLDCPFDAAGRESVDRAMHKTPLPYAGFESEFPKLRQWELDFCYPTEKCTQ